MKLHPILSVLAFSVLLTASASDEIPGRAADVARSVSGNTIGSVYELTVRVTYPPHRDGHVFVVADETGSLTIHRRFSWPAEGALKRGDLVLLSCEVASTDAHPVCACYREASVLARDGKTSNAKLPTEEEILAMLYPEPSWWTGTRITAALTSAAGLFLLIVLWNVSLRRLAERRSRELLREQIAHTQTELRIGERTRLAADLHDSVAQNLSGASLLIDTAIRNSDTDPEKMKRNLSLASNVLKISREELRNCLWDLRSNALDEKDMKTAILHTLQPVVTDASISVRFDVPRKKLSDNTAHAVLRIIRELVSNAVRHGNARNIAVTGMRNGDGITFTVADDGCGFDPDSAQGLADGHFGLTGIRERLLTLSGEMTIDSTAGKGSRITVRIS